jgi:hypothetical protein
MGEARDPRSEAAAGNLDGDVLDVRVRRALEGLLPSVEGEVADWNDVLARAYATQSTCRAGSGASGARYACGERDLEPTSPRAHAKPGQRMVTRRGPALENQGWGTRAIRRASIGLGPEPVGELASLGWGTRPL